MREALMRAFIFAAALALSCDGASAQQPAPAATLMRVTEGVFSVVEGKSIDLTDAKILLAVVKIHDRGSNSMVISIAGSTHVVSVGTRYDFKRMGIQSANDVLKTKRQCILDVTDVAIPQGARATVTFRLDCA
jgi:hypothetical protein